MRIIRLICIILVTQIVFTTVFARKITVSNHLKFNTIVVESLGNKLNATDNLKRPLKILPGRSKDITLENEGDVWYYQLQISVKKLFSSKKSPLCLWTHSPTGDWGTASVSQISNIMQPKGGPKYHCGSYWLPKALEISEWPKDFWDLGTSK